MILNDLRDTIALVAYRKIKLQRFAFGLHVFFFFNFVLIFVLDRVFHQMVVFDEEVSPF